MNQKGQGPVKEYGAIIVAVIAIIISIIAVSGGGGGGVSEKQFNDLQQTVSSLQDNVAAIKENLRVKAGPTIPQVKEPVHLKFSTMFEGSAWYAYGGTMRSYIKDELPNGSTIKVLPYPGGIGVQSLIAKEKADLGLSFQNSVLWGYKGKAAYDKPKTDLRVLLGGLDEYSYAIGVRSGLDINTWDEFVNNIGDLRLETLPKGSMGEWTTRMLLSEAGLSYDSLGKVDHTGFSTAVTKVRDGTADALAHVITKGHPKWTELTTTTDITFIPIPDELQQKMMDKYGYIDIPIKAEWGFGNNEDIQSLGLATNIVVNKSMSDGVAYAVTKALCDHPDRLGNELKALKPFDPSQAWKPKFLGAPLHEGAEIYYKTEGYK